jgi:hypothetical protein
MLLRQMGHDEHENEIRKSDEGCDVLHDVPCHDLFRFKPVGDEGSDRWA